MNVRMISWGGVLVFLGVNLPISLALSYLPYQLLKHPCKGKARSVTIQGSIVSCLILISIGYLLPQLMAPDGEYDVLFVGAPLMMFGLLFFLPIAMILGSKNSKQEFNFYAFGAGIAMTTCVCVLGMQWINPMVGLARMYGAESILSKISYIELAVCEFVFLNNNNWRFLPKNPK